MSTPPLINVPTSACVASVVMTLTRVVGLTASPFSLEEQAFKWPGEQWMIDFVMPPFTSPVIAGQWKAFGVKAEGRWGRFLLGDPSATSPKGVGTGTPQVDGGGQTGNTLITKGWTGNTQGILLAGDYIQLGSGTTSTLHMVTEDADTDSSGDAALSIAPAVKVAPNDSATITVINPRGVFRMAENSFSWSVDPGPVYRMSFRAVEVPNA